jgi:YggT family protein
MSEPSLLSAYWPYYIPTYILLAAIAYLLARAILSLFVRPDSLNVVWRMLVVTTEPILRVVRKVSPPFMIEGLMPVVAAGWLLMIWFVFRELMASVGMVPVMQLPAG